MPFSFSNELFKKGRVINSKPFLSEFQKFLSYSSLFIKVFIYKVKFFFEIAVRFENMVNFIRFIVRGVINKVFKGKLKLCG